MRSSGSPGDHDGNAKETGQPAGRRRPGEALTDGQAGECQQRDASGTVRDHADENGEREGEGKTESHRQLVSS